MSQFDSFPDDGPGLVVAALVAVPPEEDRVSQVQRLRLRIEADAVLLDKIKAGYVDDLYCRKLKSAAAGMDGICEADGLWFINDRLVIPDVKEVRAQLYRWAHDLLGHFGVDKTYAAFLRRVSA